MNYKKEHDDIAQKIARQILGTATEQDLEDIKSWKLNNVQHERLYKELLRSRNFRQHEKDLETFPFEERWPVIEKQIEAFTPPTGFSHTDGKQ